LRTDFELQFYTVPRRDQICVLSIVSRIQYLLASDLLAYTIESVLDQLTDSDHFVAIQLGSRQKLQ
jgi:hypothetical protein